MSVIKKRFTVLVVILAIAAMVFVSGCGGSKADGASSETAGNSEAKETVVTEKETAAEAGETTAAAEKTGSNIGDTGPAGGFIFYINPNYEKDGWHYLEAAPSDIPGDANDYLIKWFSGEDGIETGATATAVGTGVSNTEKIVSIQGEGSYAAKLCDELTLNGFSDWFLPSKDELDLMYKNLHLNGVGSFGDTYWSSSEGGVGRAWTQLFIDGSQKVYFGMNNGIRARAVRAFN